MMTRIKDLKLKCCKCEYKLTDFNVSVSSLDNGMCQTCYVKAIENGEI